MKWLCRACNVSLAALSSDESALNATERAIMVLENDAILNAGMPSFVFWLDT